MEGSHFTIKMLEDMGKAFCESILDYCDPDQSKVGGHTAVEARHLAFESTPGFKV